MKHVGIVACSAEGAALCYREICRQGIEVVGKHDHPRITLDSIPLARWMPAFDAGDHAALAGVMLESTRLLAAAGADFAICPDNSAHVAFEPLEAESPIPWLHIARVLAAEAERHGFRRIGILGTRFTMNGPVYPDALGSLGIEAVSPAAPDAEEVDRIIFDELVDGIFTDRSRAIYQTVSSTGWPPAGAMPSPWRARRSRYWSIPATRRCRRWTRPACSLRPRSAEAAR